MMIVAQYFLLFLWLFSFVMAFGLSSFNFQLFQCSYFNSHIYYLLFEHELQQSVIIPMWKTAEPKQFYFNFKYSISNFTISVTDNTPKQLLKKKRVILSYLRLCNEFPQKVTIPYKTLICLEHGQY